MASSDLLEKRAKEAFVDDNFDLAVGLYSQALLLDTLNPQLLADRAQAHIKLNNYTEAVADANRAIELDPSMSKAYFRKGTACMKLEEYQTAMAAFEAGSALAPDDTRFKNSIKECERCIAEEMNDVQKRLTNRALSSSAPSHPSDGVAVTSKDVEIAETVQQSTATAPVAAKPTYRHEYFQKPDEVVLTIFAKGARSKTVSVEFGEQILSLSINEDDFHFQLRLFAKIIPEKCRYEVLSTKIEIRLAKAEAISWTSLDFKEDNVVPEKLNVSSASQRPSYPSSKPRAIDWDKLEAEVKKEEKTEKLDGAAGLNKFFRDIYQDADDDARRAMMKSFVESNGTVLSTNWNEVGAKKVEATPPDGLEMKKWES